MPSPIFGRELRELSKQLDLALPDSALVAEALDCARSLSAPWLFNHVARSWLFAALLARRRGHAPDPELLAVSCLLHDVGLTSHFDGRARFEVHGANFARDWAGRRGVGGDGLRQVWDAIALHTTGSIAMHKEDVVRYCHLGIGVDYGGWGWRELAPEGDRVLSALPRLGMKRALTTCLCGIAQRFPQTAADNFLGDYGRRFVDGFAAPSSVDMMLDAPFPE
ncbi:hypothetical protein DK842_04765 [Chromobacterium phragmitis]|uniref:HD domain-containing protein n=1 Tax=Chromobacterium phragmitis TaxID=2202141 RepID=A0ABV0IXT9_9NEIS|nr:HD domain-containing protein [Chromobacterium phragmitis]AXE29281.1 hypothetical protein DK842_04765 [Chromobacterium phragmitis]